MDIPLEEITDADAATFDFSTCYTATNPGSPIRKSDLVLAIRFSCANYAEIGRLLNRRRLKIYDVINADVTLRAIFAEVRETLLDELEGGVFASARKGDAADRRFVLTTIGKSRGYTTGKEVSGPDGGPISIEQYDLSKLSDEELEKLEDLLGKADEGPSGNA